MGGLSHCRDRQREALCRKIIAPARLPAALAADARELALELSEAVGGTGVVAVELFLTARGLLVNEVALPGSLRATPVREEEAAAA